MGIVSKLYARFRQARDREKFRKEFYSRYQTNLIPDVPFDLSVLRRIGRYSYGALNVVGYGGSGESIEIGEFVSIASGVVFHLGGDHSVDKLSTFPFGVYALGMPYDPLESVTKGPVIVHDDVWIGYRALILSGVEIGQGAVIGAGSVVAKSIPPYTVAVGNPARVIKYRFSSEIIQILCSRLDYRKLTVEVIRSLRPMLEQPLTRESLENILKSINS